MDRCDEGVECVAVGCNGDGSRRWQGAARLQRRRRYTTGVKVLVNNAAGKVVLDTVAGGAFLLARLPSGTYTVTTERDGNIETSRVQVDEKRASLALFEWNPAVKGSIHAMTRCYVSRAWAGRRMKAGRTSVDDGRIQAHGDERQRRQGGQLHAVVDAKAEGAHTPLNHQSA